ncbi:MAG: SDR family NAD(P)-dependent oxidoreductase [Myxococcota bacterium]
MSDEPRTILITGANSGLGFEAAARFAELGYGRVVLVARTLQKGEDARRRLRERVARDPFEVLPVDLAKLETVDAAIGTLQQRGRRLDALILNAGVAGGATPQLSETGIELGFASSLLGHHALTVGLLRSRLLADQARIVIASAEAVNGELSMMAPTDVTALADAHFSGNRRAALLALARVEAPYAYKPAPHYSTVKLVGAWWAQALSERLPDGMAVYAVSPCSTPGTGAARNQPWLVRNLVMPVMGGPIGRWTGAAHSVATAADRYVEAIGWGTDRSGELWASASGKMTGPLAPMRHPHVLDRQSAEAAWAALCDLTEQRIEHAAAMGG